MTLEVKNVYKSFGTKGVLKDVSFSASSGSALGLLGRNGAGKTTIMRIIMRFFNADEGSILLDNKTFYPENYSIGYLPEERGLYPKKPIGSQLIYLARLKGLSTKDAKANTVKWLERLGLEDQFSKKLNTLSKGNQQKIQLAASLVNDPDIVILDEPFSGLDPVNAVLLKNIVKELVDDGKIVIFSSHQMNYVEEFCDRIALLNRGTIVLHDSIFNIKKSYPNDNVFVSFTKPQNIESIKNFVDDHVMSFEAQKAGANTEKEAYSFIMKLKDDVSKDAMLRMFVDANYEIDDFHVIEPTLEEIFVDKAGDAI
ncbi:MAG TPA: ATP-binding cassette domain-containing protein [Clostridia bacterium]|jgi:ABC-2 type transport system ATP-binding protein|nr:ABC transporter ATP-binding protein [Clostridiaceae bacterium]HOA31495.1 ATP-binding cassette domain-containing protein [Clostridia bacterium]HPZ51578.1 ATP-binding cassette domain-containing protein [Clostridia bacterium]